MPFFKSKKAYDRERCRRKHRRYESHVVMCELGEVKDISAGGMRIQCEGKPPLRLGRSANIKLSFVGGGIVVTVEAVWHKRRGLKQHEIGMQFIGVSEEMTKALDSLARFGFIGGAEQTVAGRRPQTRITAAVELPDYYQVLGVQPNCTDEDIKAAYRQLSKEHHPDVSHEAEAVEKFAVIQDAYKILSDPAQRRSYDMRQAG